MSLHDIEGYHEIKENSLPFLVMSADNYLFLKGDVRAVVAEHDYMNSYSWVNYDRLILGKIK